MSLVVCDVFFHFWESKNFTLVCYELTMNTEPVESVAFFFQRFAITIQIMKINHTKIRKDV